jgi:L-alanine-DL-glutamate epimerase-like enolase superfamily enzyme
LVAAVPNGLIIPACPDVEPYEIWSKLYNPRLEINNGTIQMSDKPGLGLDLDWDFVNAHRVER